MTLALSDQTVGSILSDEVYHTSGQTINVSNLGWVPVNDPATNQPMYVYDQASGYYGEAWGKPNGSGGYSEIMQVSRGTVVSAAGTNTFNSNANLAANSSSDRFNTMVDDAQIVATNATNVTSIGVSGTPQDYTSAAQSLYTKIVNAYGTSIPIVEVGQSYGGFTADFLVAKNIGTNSNISAITYNALPYTPDEADADGVTSGDITKADAAITNNYVGNEQLTQNPFVGTALGSTNLLGDLPVNGPNLANSLEIHSTDAAVAEEFLNQYPVGSANYVAAKALLAAIYPNASTNPDQSPIASVLAGSTPTSDNSTGGVIYSVTPDGTAQATSADGSASVMYANGYYAVTTNDGSGTTNLTTYNDADQKTLTASSTGNSVSGTFFDDAGNAVMSFATSQGEMLWTKFTTPNYDQFQAAVANALAAQVISKFLFANNLPASLTLQALAAAGVGAGLSGNYELSSFSAQFTANLTSMAAGIGGSIVGTDLAKLIGIPTVLGSTAGSIISSAVTQQVTTYIIGQTFGSSVNVATNATLLDTLTEEEFINNVGLAFESAGFALLGQQVTNAILGNGNEGSQIGGAIGEAILGNTLGPIGAFLGEIGGSLIGYVIGDIFGEGSRGKPLVAASIRIVNGQFQTTNAVEDNNGNIQDALTIASSVEGYLNQILASIGGTATYSAEWYIGYHAERGLEFQGGGPDYNFNNVSDAVNDVAYKLLRSVQITGGNPIMMWELLTSPAANINDLINDMGLAQEYSAFTANPLQMAISLASSDSVSTYQTFQSQMSSANSLGLGRLSYDGTTLTINTWGSQLSGDLSTLANMPGTAYTFAFADIGANFMSSLGTLVSQANAGHLTSVHITDSNPTLSFSAIQVGADINVLKLLSGSFTLNVTDSATNVVANLSALQTLASINALTSVTLTGSGTQTLNISAAQLLNDASVFSKIATADTYVVTDTAANVSSVFANLVAAQAAGKLTSVTTTDSGTAVLTLSDSQINQTATLAKFTKSYNFALVDTGTNVAANLSSLQTLAASGKLVSVALTDTTLPTISVTLAQTSSLSNVLALLAGKAILTVTGVQPNMTTTIPGTGFTVNLAANDTVQGSGTDTYVSSLSGASVATTLTNTQAVVDGSGNVTFTTPLTGFGNSVLHVGANGNANFTIGSDVLAFQGNALRSTSYNSGVFNFGIAAANSNYTAAVTWNPTTGQANLVTQAAGQSPVTTSLGQVNPGTAFVVSGSTITNTNSSNQILLSTTINADGSQTDTIYNYSGGSNKDTAITYNTSGLQIAERWDHTDGSSYTSYMSPTTQAVIANLTVNANGSGSISTANNQTVTFATGNIASASVGSAGDTLLTLKTQSGSGITETLDMSSGQVVTNMNGNTLTYTLANAGASVDASGNITITGGGSALILPKNNSVASFTVGSAVLNFPQGALQSISSVNGTYIFGLASQAYTYTEALSWNPTTGIMNLLLTPAGGTTATTPLGLFNPGNVLSISGATISISSGGTTIASTTVNADGSQSNTFNNGAGALHVAGDGTTVFIDGSDQLTFEPNMLLSSSSSGGIFTFNIATPSTAYTESITWNPANGMASLVVTPSGKSAITTSLGQINPGDAFVVSSNAVSLSNSSNQLLQTTTISPDGSQVGIVFSSSGSVTETITTLNNSGQQTSIRWNHTDGSSYTSFTNPSNQATIANFSVNADGSGYVSTNNSQTINFAAGNTTNVSISGAGDTILSVSNATSGVTETLDMSSGKIITTVNGVSMNYTLANAGGSIDASGNITLTGGGSTIVIPANGSNATFSVGQDSLSFAQSDLNSLAPSGSSYLFGITSSVTGKTESISWNPNNGMASLILTPTGGGSAFTTSIGQINPGNVLTLSGNNIQITDSSGNVIYSTEVYSDGSQLNVYANNTNSVNETVTTINASGQTTSVRWDNHDGSQYTQYYTPSTGAVLANRQVNSDGSGYVATANNHTINFAAGNLFVVSLQGSGNPLITVTNTSGSLLTQTIDVQSSQFNITTNGQTLNYSMSNPSFNYDGSGNLTLVGNGSTLVIPANGSNYNFAVGQDTLSFDPASVTAIGPYGTSYIYTLKPQTGAGTGEYVLWNPQTGQATINMVATNGTTTQTSLGYINPGNVMKVSSSLITTTNSSGQELVAYAVETNGSIVSTSQNGSTTFSSTNSLLGLATGVTASITGSGDTIYASTGDSITNTGNAANTYVYGSGFGTETLNNAGTASGSAKGAIQFQSGITDQNLWLVQSGNNLVIDQIGTSNQITVSNWFSNASSQVSTIQTNGDGLKLDSQVAQLVSAMATYAANHTGFNPATSGTVMPTDTTLQNAITSAWHH